jgi:hypothetical protein
MVICQNFLFILKKLQLNLGKFVQKKLIELKLKTAGGGIHKISYNPSQDMIALTTHGQL